MNDYESQIDKAELTEVTDQTYSFYLKIPGEGRMCCSLITFTPEGISIMGDLCPGRNGVVSVYGKGLGWFSGELSASYLAEKFLEEEFVPEVAATELLAEDCWLREDASDQLNNDLDEIASRLQFGEAGAHDLVELMCEHGLETCDGIPGWTYNPRDVELLSAIQKKFAELRPAWKPKEEE